MYICIRIHTLIERNLSPRGGFLFTMFPHQEPCVRGPPSKHLVHISRGGSSYTMYSLGTHCIWHSALYMAFLEGDPLTHGS